MAAAGKLLLVDANALVHRSYHALAPLTSPKGELVNAVYGYASTLLKAIKDEKPTHVAVCYDVGRYTFRDKIYKEYKAKRQETDPALSAQIPRTKDLTAALNIPIYEKEGVEADDLIGSLSTLASKKGLQTVIVTGDKDTLQLVDDDTSVYSLHRGVNETLIYNRKMVKERLGVYPEQVVDFKALAGDASDNIPGVAGIGIKTATDLLSRYRDIEGIYRHLPALPEPAQLKLTKGKKLMEISRRLAKIKTDLNIKLDLKEAATANFDFSQAVGFLQELGFKSLLTRLPTSDSQLQGSLFIKSTKGAPAKATPSPLPHQVVTTPQQWRSLAQTLSQLERLAIDTETVDLEGALIGVSFAWGHNDSAYLPLKPHPDGLPLEAVRGPLQTILANEAIKKIGHNLKYDLGILRQAGFEVQGVWFDTMIATALANSQLFSSRLDDVAFAELGFRKIPLTELIGAKKNRPMTEVPLEKLAAYSAEDALITWRLFEKLKPDLEAGHLKRVFYEIEMPLLPVLQQMEGRGIKIDQSALKKLSRQLKGELSRIQKRTYQAAGGQFNLNSPTQLKEVLFTRLKLSTAGIKRVQAGHSTNAESLMKLRDKHPVIPLILEYRELSKLVSTYVETLPKLADHQSRVHTSYTQLGAATGRLASTNPNLQNIPIRTELGMAVRRCFVAGPGQVLIGADYSQAELRVLAHISGDEGLIGAFHKGDDFHESVGKKLMVDRRTAKAINFGIVYGLGPSSLAEDLGIPFEAAKQFIDRYFATFPGVKKYINETAARTRRDGFAETLFGRRRYLPEINSPNPMLRSAAERAAVNHPAQGTVADIMKLAMVELSPKLPEDTAMLLQIHDELLFEVRLAQVEAAAKIIRQVMGGIVELKVPLVVDVKVGPNWADLQHHPKYAL